MSEGNDISLRVAEITGRINRIRPRHYPIWVLEKMMKDLEFKRQGIVEELMQLEFQVTQKMTAGDTEAITTIQEQAQKLKKQDDALKENYRSLFDQRQHNVLKARIIAKLGSEVRYQLKEAAITVLILFVLLLMLGENLNPDLSDENLQLFFYLDASCCLAFLLNFFFDLSLAESKTWFWKRHFLDFITSIPIPQARTVRLLRGMRVVRLLRLARLLRILKLLRILLFFGRGFDHLAHMLDFRLMRKSLLYVVTSLVIGAVAFQFFEGSNSETLQGGMIHSLWWSFATVVTGGFADIQNPETTGGKILTVILVLIGMVVVGIFTATLTTIMVEDDDDILLLRDDMNEQLSQLMERVERIERNTAPQLGESTLDQRSSSIGTA